MAPAQIGLHRHRDSEYQGTVLEKGISEKEFFEWDNPSESTIVHHRKGESVRSGSFNLTCFGTCARIAPLSCFQVGTRLLLFLSFNLTCFGTCARIAPLSCFQVGYLPAQPRSAWPARIPGRCSKESIVQLNLKPPRVRQQHRALGVLSMPMWLPLPMAGVVTYLHKFDTWVTTVNPRCCTAPPTSAQAAGNVSARGLLPT